MDNAKTIREAVNQRVSIKDINNNVLVAIKLDEIKNAKKVNEVKSIYGKTALKEYLVKHAEKKQLHIINKNKAQKYPVS